MGDERARGPLQPGLQSMVLGTRLRWMRLPPYPARGLKTAPKVAPGRAKRAGVSCRRNAGKKMRAGARVTIVAAHRLASALFSVNCLPAEPPVARWAPATSHLCCGAATRIVAGDNVILRRHHRVEIKGPLFCVCGECNSRTRAPDTRLEARTTTNGRGNGLRRVTCYLQGI